MLQPWFLAPPSALKAALGAAPYSPSYGLQNDCKQSTLPRPLIIRPIRIAFTNYSVRLLTFLTRLSRMHSAANTCSPTSVSSIDAVCLSEAREGELPDSTPQLSPSPLQSADALYSAYYSSVKKCRFLLSCTFRKLSCSENTSATTAGARTTSHTHTHTHTQLGFQVSSQYSSFHRPTDRPTEPSYPTNPRPQRCLRATHRQQQQR